MSVIILLWLFLLVLVSDFLRIYIRWLFVLLLLGECWWEGFVWELVEGCFVLKIFVVFVIIVFFRIRGLFTVFFVIMLFLLCRFLSGVFFRVLGSCFFWFVRIELVLLFGFNLLILDLIGFCVILRDLIYGKVFISRKMIRGFVRLGWFYCKIYDSKLKI